MNFRQFIKTSFLALVGSVILATFLSSKPVMSQSIDLGTLNKAALAQHNAYRAKHGVPAMTLDPTVSATAQAWAEKLAETDTFEHEKPNKYGENLYVTYSTASSMDAKALAEEAIKGWYDEIEKYSFDQPGFTSGTGHFTQVVWKGSTQLGCGAAQGTSVQDGTKFNAFYVACRYNPPGNLNTAEAFTANVLPPQ